MNNILLQIMIYTVIWGSIYLLISLGFSLICGVLRIFHLGYGVVFVIAAYVTWFFMEDMHLGLLPSLLLMILVQCYRRFLWSELRSMARGYRKSQIPNIKLQKIAFLNEKAS